MVAVQIHFGRHVLFDDALEVFSRDVVIEIRLDKVLHHFDEAAVTVLGRIKHHPNHVQDVRPLGIHEKLIGSAGLGVAQSIALRDWTDGVRLDVVSRRPRLRNHVALIVPKVIELFDVVANELHVKRC